MSIQSNTSLNFSVTIDCKTGRSHDPWITRGEVLVTNSAPSERILPALEALLEIDRRVIENEKPSTP